VVHGWRLLRHLAVVLTQRGSGNKESGQREETTRDTRRLLHSLAAAPSHAAAAAVPARTVVMPRHHAPWAALACALLALCVCATAANSIGALGGAAQDALRTASTATRAGADTASDAAQQALARAKRRVALPRRSVAAAAAAAPSPEEGAAGAAPRCTASAPLAAQTRLNVSMDIGGRSRFFLLQLPQGYDTKASPLLLVLHGAGSTAAGFLDGGACSHAWHTVW
jgi:hypothetical protein